VSNAPALSAAIDRALTPLHEVRAALLFGSHARGRARPDSDIDVAVLLTREAAQDEASELRRLIGALAGELAADRLDVVILNHAPPALAFQVLKYGREVLVRDPAELVAFRVRTYGAHADYAHVERFFREATRRRLLGAGSARG
jgi:uncharacterized protein